MKKLIIIPLLFILLSVQGQNGRYPFYRGVTTTAPSGNMISNGTFDNETDWGTAGITIAGGVASYDDTGNDWLRQAPEDMVSNVQANVTYSLEFDVSITSGSANIRLYNYSTSVAYTEAVNYNNGHVTTSFTAPANVDGGGFFIYCYEASDNPFTIDNVELTPQ